MDKQSFGKSTLYFLGMFGYTQKEVREVEVEVRPYAQYERAVHFRFKDPRQKSFRSGVQGYRPNLIILEGWGHVGPASPFKETEMGTISRYHMGALEYQVEFEKDLTEYLEKNPEVKVLADFRGLK